MGDFVSKNVAAARELRAADQRPRWAAESLSRFALDAIGENQNEKSMFAAT
jgi:hypothetical protein